MLYLHQGNDIFMTVCLYVCLLKDNANATHHNFMKRNQKMGLGLTWTPINFESDLDHCLDTKKKYLIGRVLYSPSALVSAFDQSLLVCCLFSV